jgi:hypothetical protein
MRVAVAGLLMSMAIGCSGRPAMQHSAAMESSARMLAKLDKMEADLASEDTTETTYAVLAFRHGQAEQMACHVTDEHVEEIHRLDVAQQKKMLEKHKKRLAVASR